jgi:integrase
MQHQGTLAVSGHVFCVKRKRGPQFYAKYRIGSKQIQRRLGPAWSESGAPPPGYYTRKTAEAELAAILTDARRGAVPHSTGSGVTVRSRRGMAAPLRVGTWRQGLDPERIRLRCPSTHPPSVERRADRRSHCPTD